LEEVDLWGYPVLGPFTAQGRRLVLAKETHHDDFMMLNENNETNKSAECEYAVAILNVDAECFAEGFRR